MGFRDLRLFNQALLAKQAWRLVQRPDSLYARVLKAKYYPKGNLLGTVFTSDGSPVWRGIEYGLELLKKRVVWRVGNGKSIQILRDNWIPRQSGLSIQSMKTRSRLRWVNQLLLPHSNDWTSRSLTSCSTILTRKKYTRSSFPQSQWGHSSLEL